jgi:hypothetical protein
VAESRARRQIRQAVEKKGGRLINLAWLPPRWEENLGPVGGWSLEAEHPRQPNPSVPMHAQGHNLATVLEEIASWPAASTQPPSPQAEVQDCERCGGTGKEKCGCASHRPDCTVTCLDCDGTGKQSPAEPQGDLIQSIAKVFYEREKALLGGKVKPFEEVRGSLENTARELLPEPQGDLVEETARWLFENYGPGELRAYGWDAICVKDHYRASARDLLAAITPFLPGSSYVRERLTGDEARNAFSNITVGVEEGRVEELGEAGAQWVIDIINGFLDTRVPSEPKESK